VTHTQRASSLAVAVARGAALFFGGVSLLNVVGERVSPGFDSNHWWLDASRLPRPIGTLLIVAGAAAMIAFAVRPRMGNGRRKISIALFAALLAVAGVDTAVYYHVKLTNHLFDAPWAPLSLAVLATLTLLLWAALRNRSTTSSRAQWFALSATFGLLTILAPLAQMFVYGNTDYRRPADAIVVLGARVYANGRTSDAAADRVATACDLYHRGLAPRLILSGGPGDGDIHETEGMRRLAIRLGVPPEAIATDTGGIDTEATARNTLAMSDELGARRLLVVSHFYHLPRVKLAYQREGRLVYTVPAKQTYILSAMPIYIAREVAADWLYYLRPLWRA